MTLSLLALLALLAGLLALALLSLLTLLAGLLTLSLLTLLPLALLLLALLIATGGTFELSPHVLELRQGLLKAALGAGSAGLRQTLGVFQVVAQLFE